MAQQRFAQAEACILLTGSNQKRRFRLHGVVQHTQSIAEPWRDMKIDYSGLAGCLGVVARCTQCDALMESHDIAQLRVVSQTVHDGALSGPGVPKNEAHAVSDQTLHQHLLASHADLLSLS